MTEWSHITGIVRVDIWPGPLTRFNINSVNKDIKDALGRTCSFKQKLRGCKSTIPSGKDCSVLYKIVSPEPNDDIINYNTIIFHGDLKDYDNINEFFQWVRDSFEKLKQDEIHIKDMCILFNIGYVSKYLITYIYEEDEIVLIDLTNKK